MRFLFLLLISTLLFAKNKDVCYTVQLFSIPSSQKENIKEDPYLSSQECKMMQISKTLTMRCGCYDQIKDANQKLIIYKERYHHAIVAMSYKYRFNISYNQKRTAQKIIQDTKGQKHNYDENELRLLLQSFLYSKDLKHAYKTIELALQKNPSSLYWNQKMAEVLRWMGRGEDAIGYMEFIYYQSKKPQLAKEIIDYALKSYQYEKVTKLVKVAYINNPTNENKKRMLYIYQQIGKPKQAAKILENQYYKNHDPLLLSDILQIYMNSEDLKNAKRIIQLIEQKKLYSTQNIELISYYNYVSRDIPNAYAILQNFNFSQKYNRHLNELLSDLGWYLQHYKKASEASLRLIRHKDGRLVDYERVIYTSRESNPELALEMTQEAFKKYHLDYLFYDFANQALKAKKIAFLQETIKDIDASNSLLKYQPNYWIIKARLYNALKNKRETIIALQQANKLAKNNPMYILQIIDIYMRLCMYDEVKYMLNKLTMKKDLPDRYLLTIAALYFTIHDVNQASFYLQKLKELGSPLQESIDFKFLQDDIYKAQFNENAHFQTLREIRKILQKKLSEKPALAHNDKFLYSMLKVSLYLDSVDIFKQKLQKSKKYLSTQHYYDIAYSYATKIHSNDMAHTIYQKTQMKAYWLDYANALLQEDHTTKADLLLYHLQQIPRDDAAYGAHQIGQIALSQSLTFDSLEENEKNKNAYISMLNYSKERTSLLDIKGSYYNREPLLQKYTDINNRLYLRDGYYLLNRFYYTKNTTLDSLTLPYVPSSSSRYAVGVEKIFNKAKVIFNASAVDSIKEYLSFDLLLNYKINNYFSTELKIEKNSAANESIELLLAGKKDSASFKLTTYLLHSTSFEIKYTQNRYYSEDDIYLGDGSYINALLAHQIRNGYPDMRIIFAINYAKFNETLGYKGVIEQLQTLNYKVLPNNFYDVGLIFDYGMQNSTIYTRVWRPFFEVSTFYNSETGGINYAVNVGYGGKLYLQDHLSMGVNYSNNISGIEGTLFELFLRYEFLYPSGF